MGFIEVHVTFPDMESAKEVTGHLLRSRLIACVNLIPIASAYWWKGSIEETREVLAVLKTRKGNWRRLKAEVGRMHIYDIPGIVRIDVESNAPYEKWVNDETGSNTAP